MTNAMMRNGFYGEELDMDQLDMVNGGIFSNFNPVNFVKQGLKTIGEKALNVIDKVSDHLPVISSAKKTIKQVCIDVDNLNDNAGLGTFFRHFGFGLARTALATATFGATDIAVEGLELIEEMTE